MFNILYLHKQVKVKETATEKSISEETGVFLDTEVFQKCLVQLNS